MLDVYEQYGVIEPMKRGEIESIVELLRSGKNISPKVRSALADFLENPPKKKRGCPPADIDTRVMRAIKIAISYKSWIEKGATPGEALRSVSKQKGILLGEESIRDMIYCKKDDKKFVYEWPIIHSILGNIIKRNPRTKKL